MDVLSRLWLQNKYGVRESDIEVLLKLLLLRGERVRPEREIRACRDPKDDEFLEVAEVAVAGEAELVVTGDDDLLALHPFEGIEILPPARFRERLEDPAAGAIS